MPGCSSVAYCIKVADEGLCPLPCYVSSANVDLHQSRAPPTCTNTTSHLTTSTTIMLPSVILLVLLLFLLLLLLLLLLRLLLRLLLLLLFLLRLQLPLLRRRLLLLPSIFSSQAMASRLASGAVGLRDSKTAGEHDALILYSKLSENPTNRVAHDSNLNRLEADCAHMMISSTKCACDGAKGSVGD